MNTNALKRFAQQTRTLLLEQVATRLHLVLKTDSVELRERAEQVAALRTALQTTTAAELVDKVAYTWFNRLVALRYMDVNGYQPLGVRIVSPAETDESHPLPEVLQLAQQGMIDSELLPDQARVMGLLRGTIPSQNVDNEVYRELLVGACNSLHTLFPFLFEPLQDHTELLLPADLTTMYSVVYKVRNELLDEDCQHVEVLGWLYQFYIAERKDAVFAAKTKVKKEDIPAATQLFTPRWIVEYMVQNTVGKLWLQHHPDSGLRQHMPYFLDSASLYATDKLPLSGPEELTVLDPACGSGHLLIYAFELLAHIYEEEAYSKAEIPGLILTHNLRGLEIDERAAQLAGFALMMKARSYHNRAFRKELTPHITHLKPLALRTEQAQAVLAQAGQQGSLDLWHDIDALRQIDNIGSLLVPRTLIKELLRLKKLLDQPASTADMFRTDERQKLNAGLDTLLELSQKHACVAANPPYMGGGNMNAELSSFVRLHYSNSKSDLMACFMESSLAMLKPRGFLGMINQQSWMFVSSYAALRKDLTSEIFIDTLLHLGPRTFPEISGEKVQNAAFTFYNQKLQAEGHYVKLTDFDSSEAKRNQVLKESTSVTTDYTYYSNQSSFKGLPGTPIGYWVPDNVIDIFKHPSLEETHDVREGVGTRNDERFIRYAWEVAVDEDERAPKWIQTDKAGGSYKWYNAYINVMDWGNNGHSIKNYKNPDGSIKSRPQNTQYFFRPAVTWSKISTGQTAFRYRPEGFGFNDAAPSIFGDNLFYIAGFLNSSLANDLIAIKGGTINLTLGIIKELPLIISHKKEISSLSEEAVAIAKQYWTNKDYISDFKEHALLTSGCSLLSEAASAVLQQEYIQSNKLIEIEKRIDYLFSEIYGIKNTKHDYAADNLRLYDTEIAFFDKLDHGHNLKAKDYEPLIIDFISYAIGCLFGRFSLDKPGVILANKGETLVTYLKKVAKAESELSFIPDRDNIIPLLDEEWFEDDIVAGFTGFLKVTLGEDNLAKNLSFIEDCLGRSLRQYFTKDFYSDHIKRYNKRPIYWQFSSPNRVFNALVYIHRYTPDTLNLILNRYMRPLQTKFQERIERLKNSQISADYNSAERARALKEQDKLEQQLRELQVYERDVLLPLASARIAIDLDEGVLVNYNKFGKAVREISGLNDAKAKAKVRAFDWIDATQIR